MDVNSKSLNHPCPCPHPLPLNPSSRKKRKPSLRCARSHNGPPEIRIRLSLKSWGSSTKNGTVWRPSSRIRSGHCFKRQAISHGNCAALATLQPLSMYSRLPPLFLQCWWRPLWWRPLRGKPPARRMPRQWQTLVVVPIGKANGKPATGHICRVQKNCMLAHAKPTFRGLPVGEIGGGCGAAEDRYFTNND